MTKKKIMSMTLHVVIPPHPLIGHWLSILRIESTPSPIYSTSLEQLGIWLTYEALRDWLPYSKKEIPTKTLVGIEQSLRSLALNLQTFQTMIME